MKHFTSAAVNKLRDPIRRGTFQVFPWERIIASRAGLLRGVRANHKDAIAGKSLGDRRSWR